MKNQADMPHIGHAGLFGGLINHSITLGIISGIAICGLLYVTIRKSWKYLFLIFPCLCSIFFAASRGALIATICSVIIMLLFSCKNYLLRKKVFKLLLIAIPVLLYLIANTNVLEGINQKNSSNTGNLLSSREYKYTARIEEFKSSPILGVGFCAIDDNGNDSFNEETGGIEPGTSWLALLSMTGLIGFSLFIYIYIGCFKILITADTNNSLLLVGLLSYFGVNMFSEGYILSAGSPLCFLLWLVIGCSVDLLFIKKNYYEC